MEPMHIYALLHTQVDAEMLRKETEQYFAVRSQLRRERRKRIRRVRQLVTRRRAPAPTPRSVATAG